eukprot:g1257.t1
MPRISSIAGISEAVQKCDLASTLAIYRAVLGSSHFSFVPTTYILPRQMQDLRRDVHRNPLSTFIYKPSRGLKGKGIRLFQGPDMMEAICARASTKDDSDHAALATKPAVVQAYIAPLLLQDGLKFDLRLYVLIDSLDSAHVYLCEEGMARFCTQKYRRPSPANMGEVRMHLTNFACNRDASNFVHTENILEPNTMASKRLLSSIFPALSSAGCDVGRLQRQIDMLIVRTVASMMPKLQHRAVYGNSSGSSFHLVGFDVLLDESFQPHLLEVNANPSLRTDFKSSDGAEPLRRSPVDEAIKTKAVRGALAIAFGAGREGCEEAHGYRKLVFDDICTEMLKIGSMATQFFSRLAARSRVSAVDDTSAAAIIKVSTIMRALKLGSKGFKNHGELELALLSIFKEKQCSSLAFDSLFRSLIHAATLHFPRMCSLEGGCCAAVQKFLEHVQQTEASMRRKLELPRSSASLGHVLEVQAKREARQLELTAAAEKRAQDDRRRAREAKARRERARVAQRLRLRRNAIRAKNEQREKEQNEAKAAEKNAKDRRRREALAWIAMKAQ